MHFGVIHICKIRYCSKMEQRESYCSTVEQLYALLGQHGSGDIVI